MKKLVLIPIFLILIVIIPIAYSRVNSIIQSRTQPSAYLSIKELKGTDNIYIDGSLVGQTPYLNKPIDSGEHIVLITNKDNKDKYFQLSRKLNFDSNTNTYINAQLGPNEIYSFYEILSPSVNNGQTGINIFSKNTSLQDTQIILAGNPITIGSVQILKSGEYDLVLKKDGYIGIDNQVSINQGYILNNEFHLFKQPI